MAKKLLTPAKGPVNEVAKFTFVAADAVGDGFEFVMPKITEEYVVIVVQNSGNGEATVTLKKPENGSYAAAGSDTELALAAGEFAQIRIESARYAENTGKVTIVGSDAGIKVAVLY
jgi:hypothetical protein